MAGTYLVEVSDDGKTGKIVLPVARPEIQRPAAEFVFDILGADPDRVVSERKLPGEDARLLAHLQDLIFTRDGQELVIRDGVEFEANSSPLNPDAQLEEYFLPRTDRAGEVYICEIEVQSGDPERARRKQMKAYQVMFALHRFKRGYQTTMADVDTLRPISDEAESRGLLQFDMARNTFALTEQGGKVYQSVVNEAQELIRRYDLFSDTDVSGGHRSEEPTIRFGTGQGQDLRVPIWELNGINPFRARFVLGLNDGEWDDLPDWPRQISAPRWFDEIFAPVEQAPTIDQVGRDRCERIFDEGKAQLRGDGASEPQGGTYTTQTYDDPGTPGGGYYYRDPFVGNSLWWLMFMM